MLSEVMEYYGFKKPLDHLGYFETEHHTHLVKELKIVIGQGRLVALAGIVGCGKTTILQQLMLSLVQSTQPETRERKLLELMQKRRTPVALFVDDAHDLHHRTLIGLKRLIELVRQSLV